MTQITKEQVRRLRNDFECWQQDYDPKEDKEQYDMFGLGMAAMDMLIARMYQEPVAWEYEWASCITCEGPQGFKRVIERKAPPEWAIDEGQARNIIPLYAAPSARVSVPDERAAFNAWNNDTDCPLAGRDAKTAAWLAWNRRAAMLQGADGNSPVIQDGWIRCSEKMPEEHDAVLVCQEGGIIFCAEYESGCFYPDEFPNVPKEGREITHWMALPAAPKVSQ